MRRGIAVSPGVAIGTAYVIHEIFVNPDTKRLEDSQITAELANYETARDKAGADLRALERKVEAQVGREEASIFAVHQAILRDAAFTNKIRSWIVDDKMNSSAALHRLLGEYTTLFARTNDEYLQERLNDVRDVIIRLGSHLNDAAKPETGSIVGPLIVVADELLPSQVVALGDMDVNGIVTQKGSQTSHAAIVARSRGIPAVSGVSGIARKVKTGDTIVVDGRDGHIEINPNSETLKAFKKLEREFFDLKDKLATNRDQPSLTADGCELRLQGNINGVADANAACAMGASGSGFIERNICTLLTPVSPTKTNNTRPTGQSLLPVPTTTLPFERSTLAETRRSPTLATTIKKPIPLWAGGASDSLSNILNSSTLRFERLCGLQVNSLKERCA